MAKKEAKTTVKTPATTMEREDMAPSMGPSSMAFVVPIACAAVPRAMPRAMGSVIWKRRQTDSPMIFPRIPVAMMAATVIET